MTLSKSTENRSTDKNTDKPTQLYRHFDADDNLLYIGISLSAIHRLGQHKKHASWFQSITRIEVEHYGNRKAARKAEALAIYRENPKHNISRPDTIEVRIEQILEERAREEEENAPKLRLLPPRIKRTKAELEEIYRGDEWANLAEKGKPEDVVAFMRERRMI